MKVNNIVLEANLVNQANYLNLREVGDGGAGRASPFDDDLEAYGLRGDKQGQGRKLPRRGR